LASFVALVDRVVASVPELINESRILFFFDLGQIKPLSLIPGEKGTGTLLNF